MSSSVPHVGLGKGVCPTCRVIQFLIPNRFTQTCCKCGSTFGHPHFKGPLPAGVFRAQYETVSIGPNGKTTPVIVDELVDLRPTPGLIKSIDALDKYANRDEDIFVTGTGCAPPPPISRIVHEHSPANT